MSNGILDFLSLEKDPESFNLRDITDFIADPDDPLSMALAPLYFAGPLGAGANRAIRSAMAANKALNLSPLNVPAGKLAGTALGIDLTNMLVNDPEMQEILNDVEPQEQQQLLSLAQNIAEQKLSEEMKPKMADGGIVDSLPKKMNKGGIIKSTIRSIKDIYKKHFGKKSKPKEDKPTSTDKSKESLEQSSKAKKERVKVKSGEGQPSGVPSSQQVVPQQGGPLVPQGGPLVPVTPAVSTTSSVVPAVIGGLGSAAVLGSAMSPKDEKEQVSALVVGADQTPTPAPTPAPSGDVVQPPVTSTNPIFDFIQKNPQASLAGFLNMMKPREGIAPINAAVAFGEGYLGEKTRQEESVPAAIRTLEMLQENPDLAEMYLTGKGKTQKSILDQLSGFQGEQLVAIVKNALSPGTSPDRINIVDTSGNVIDSLTLLSLANQFDNITDFNNYIRQNYAIQEV